MADEQKEQDALDKVNVSDKVTINGPDQHGEYLKQNEDAQGHLQRYGFTDLQQFLNRIGSDGTFAQKVVLDQFGLEEHSALTFAPEAGANQENNVTGKLDHSGEVATLEKR